MRVLEEERRGTARPRTVISDEIRATVIDHVLVHWKDNE